MSLPITAVGPLKVETKPILTLSAAVAGCALAGKAGAAIRNRALKRLPAALAATVAPDGGHASRSPEAGLELLLDLLTLDDALLQQVFRVDLSLSRAPAPGLPFLLPAPLRDRMPRVDLDVNFETASWQLAPEQVDKLSVIADGINRALQRNPREVFMVEGYTDAVGSDEDNLSLSDRRAESVAVALTEQFNVPPENLVTQGYGKQFLKIETPAPEEANRRVAVRRITPLIDGPSASNGAR